jgi:hypothetical protein
MPVYSSILFEGMGLICLAKDPTFELGDFTPKNAQIWLQFNLFAARCLGAELVGLLGNAGHAISA